MTRRKTSSARSRTTSKRTPKRNSFAADARRFLKALAGSAVVAFSVASCVLNPQWRDTVSLDPILAELGLPGSEPVAELVAPSGQYASTRSEACRQHFPAAGTPIVPAAPALRELCFGAFAILHNGNTKTPVFVAQRLNRGLLEQASGLERTDRFFADARLPKAERAELADYRGSGYSRGHMAPAADMPDPDAMAQSFSLANMIPQHPVHNSGAWNRIERDTRKFVMRARGDVHIFTGPVYGERPRMIGEGRVAVPDYVYKVVYDTSSGRSWVHWHANSPDAAAGPPISYAEFLRRTGLHLLPGQ